jgi:glycosyltransferase involved in cell wall biosynthesis/SAM-dependent methyltransferase
MMLSTKIFPLISCIMPTYNRRAFVPRAIEFFLRQDYANRELIIVDDGSDTVGDLVPVDERFRYMHLPRKITVGAKRNVSCEQARGTIIAHWDDDDWYAPYRLSYQVGELLREGTDVCGTSTLFFYDAENGRAWQYVYPSDQRVWLVGSTLCYTRAFWEKNRFAHINVGEDARFVWSAGAGRVTRLADASFHVGMVHRQNVSPKRTNGSYWRPCSVEEIRRLLGDDWDFYQTRAVGMNDTSKPVQTGLETYEIQLAGSEACGRPQGFPAPTGMGWISLAGSYEERSVPMITVAREADLDLPEYAAFSYKQALPWMRRWELPFALFQARLANTMSVLDCTINPAGFQENLQRLYPHALYRHWSPIQNGQFVLPFGTPDGSFDRVICVNTLEHLLKPQREALVAAMARKLKRGGLLVLTSDYYFDSFWEQPAFLRAGVMRADRQDIFNGWNKITAQDWFVLCKEQDVLPMAEMVQEPREDDSSLYRNQQPYPHACIGGVFYKTEHPHLPAGKKIVLALLTWNTCQITMESMQAYMREAHMLQRLGQEPFLCVCDNGSSDGTPNALRALEGEIDIPHRFILNSDNRGNSIARNSIIDYMLECGADYLLFMDGDIEIVPFSSFAMVRYMENCGHSLGCIGADSAGQTPSRERTSPYLYSIDGCPLDTTNLVAWTQYGMFRRAVFEDGNRFDETEPFDRAGWGFEDNDLAFQMEMKGYRNQRFFGVTYLHRDARSSIRIMRERGIDAAAMYARRKQYVIDKWASIPHINNGPLTYVRRVTIRL